MTAEPTEASGDRDARGYRPSPAGRGATVRADVVDVYVVREAQGGGRGAGSGGGEPEFLQVRRSRPPLEGTWQPVMGHVEAGEPCWRAALRELAEEVGLEPGPMLLGVWALEQVYPYYIAAIDSVVLGPRFVALASPEWQPRLNEEHRDWRWVPAGRAAGAGGEFVWPGQRAAVREALELLLPGNPAREHLRLSAVAPGPVVPPAPA